MNVSYLFDFSLQVSQLDALLQVPAVLLGRQVELLLFLMEELQQVLNPCCHVNIPVAQQLNTLRKVTELAELCMYAVSHIYVHSGSVEHP